MSLQNGLTQELTAQDSITETKTYTFTSFQVKELLKSAYELDACNVTVYKLSNIVDSAQFKVNELDNIIQKKNLKIVRLKTWRNIGLSFGFAGLLYSILK